MNRSGQSASEHATLMTVERGLQVLRAFRSDRKPLTNAELVRRTGLPKATVSRLTSTLQQVGFLRLVPGKRAFELSAGALGIGHAYVAKNEMLQAAEPLMQALADQLGNSVALAIQDGLDMLYVAYRASRKVSTLRLGVGSVLPMGTTSIGRAFLWGLPIGQQQVLVCQLKNEAQSDGEALEQSIMASFAQLQSAGTCAVSGGYQRGTYGVALPIHVGRQNTLMGLSCGKADLQMDLACEHARIAPALMETAQRLEALLSGFDSHL